MPRKRLSFAALLLYLSLAFVGGLLLLQLFYFVQILWFRVVDPTQTAFMAEQAKQVAVIRHQAVAYEKISVQLKRAVMAAEDQRFDKHDGIDWDAIEKAWMLNREKGRVDGECQHDDLRVMGFDELADPEVGELVNKDGFFDQREMMADDIEEVPGSGITVDQGQIETPEKIIDPWPG
ncbi:MAG: hypothetical protein EBW84_01550 [Betaproteobacteria bacterium]|nr:hypothetical protein [Betaproteobacteria bacterium]